MAKRVRELLEGLDPVRVENPAHPGTPDVNYVEGWIELKELKKWPARLNTIVRVEHFTPQQRIWLDRRWRTGGAAWLLLKVGQDWLLLTGEVAARVLGKSTRGELLQAATKVWINHISREEFVTCLKRSTPPASS